MADRASEVEAEASEDSGVAVIRRHPARRVFAWIALGLLAIVLLAALLLWMERRPIASGYLQREFERRGVQASYHLDRVGLRTQQVSNLVIGDPKRPDLTARLAQIQMRLKLTGGIEVYRIVARGVRLRGRLVHGKVHWGQIDKLLPPPSNKPFALPNFVLDVADSSIALATPFGPLGFALQGSGNLTGGFKGRLAVASPQLRPGRCAAADLHANVAVAVVARHPRIKGPVTVDRFTCPASRLAIVSPRFDIASKFNESFTTIDGHGRMAIDGMTAGENGLAQFIGELTFNGTLGDVRGSVKLAAQNSRLATIFADRTSLKGQYELGIGSGKFSLAGDYDVDSARLAPSMLAGVVQPLAAVANTPIGPVASAVRDALQRLAGNFDSDGQIRVVNFPGGGAARIDTAEVSSARGGRARVSGGSGITYYWPAGGLRIDTNIQLGGGGLPNGRISLHQLRPGGPMSGLADLAPYTARGSSLSLAPIRFDGTRDGSTTLSTVALFDGPFPNGRVQALRVPISGRLGQGGSFAFGAGCAQVSFAYLRTGSLQLGPTRLPVCPLGPAIVAKPAGGAMRIGARFHGPVLNGRLGQSPLHVAAAGGQIVGTQFAFNGLTSRLGKPESPVVFDASRLTGTFANNGAGGVFSGARSTIGKVPLLMSDIGGRWRFHNGDVSVDGGLTVSDRNPNPRFYPLHSDDVRFTLTKDMVRADGTLRHPATGTRVTDVTIEHRLSAGEGHALLDVPGIAFGRALQPDQLTRLTEGVIALVNGTLSGQGRIDWSGSNVTSTGDFSTAHMDLAAPFGPVSGLKGTIHFSDLLGLVTPPGQVATIQSINPGILVENGVIHYQLLPGQLVRIERGEWPFMGGRLILQETVLNFGRPSAKRLTFQVVGLDAKTFVDTLGFKEISATGRFDGVLPMIFDENGGRIVGGRLDSRPPGGSLSYVGVVNRANLGLMAKIAFDALKDLRYRSMIVRLDGDLAGEFASRITIDQLGLSGSTGSAKLIRSAFRKVPFRFNINIRGPFRALIQTAKSYRDPRQQINDVLPRPLDSVPGIVTEVRREDESQTQSQTPVNQKITVTPTPPARSEKRP